MDYTSPLRPFRTSVCWFDVRSVTYVDSRLANICHLTLLTCLAVWDEVVDSIIVRGNSLFAPYIVHIWHWFRYIVRDHDAILLSGFDSRNVQPVVSRYTDWAIPTPPYNPYLRNTTYRPIEYLPNQHKLCVKLNKIAITVVTFLYDATPMK
jgi:hypothetical protein